MSSVGARLRQRLSNQQVQVQLRQGRLRGQAQQTPPQACNQQGSSGASDDEGFAETGMYNNYEPVYLSEEYKAWTILQWVQ
mmetsp:Transcript_2157/g.3177  ORF Transcript_2157/g.3177 Transcript_2157/m.3177 type:complete len:81 (-) Transcript_2157:240-482(-)